MHFVDVTAFDGAMVCPSIATRCLPDDDAVVDFDDDPNHLVAVMSEISSLFAKPLLKLITKCLQLLLLLLLLTALCLRIVDVVIIDVDVNHDGQLG